MPKKYLETIRTKLKEILKLTGSPHSVALGAAVGVFWNFIPSLGVGPFLSMGLARMIRGSAVAALTANLATGFFIPIFYSMNMITGRFLKGDKVQPIEIEETLQGSIQESMIKMEEIVEKPVNYFSLDKMQDFTADFLIGAVVNALIGATIIYFVFLFILTRKYRTNKNNKNQCI